jgi:uncharacterized protein YdaT
MPWDSKTILKRNGALKKSPAKAKKAASIATGALKSGVPEGEALAIANKWAKTHSAPSKTTKSATPKLKKR